MEEREQRECDAMSKKKKGEKNEREKKKMMGEGSTNFVRVKVDRECTTFDMQGREANKKSRVRSCRGCFSGRKREDEERERKQRREKEKGGSRERRMRRRRRTRIRR